MSPAAGPPARPTPPSPSPTPPPARPSATSPPSPPPRPAPPPTPPRPPSRPGPPCCRRSAAPSSAAGTTLITAAREDLARIMTREQGKPISESRGEIDYAASFVEFYAEEARRPNIEGVTSHLRDAEVELWREPAGVAALITPWNFPCAMITRKAAAALAAGCTVVVHPSARDPLLGARARRARRARRLSRRRLQRRHRRRRRPSSPPGPRTRASACSPSPARPRSAACSTASPPTP